MNDVNRHADLPTKSDNLATWLDWMAVWHPVGIDLGLDRSGTVFQRMDFSTAAIPTIIVGGTNGKGSVTAFLEAILQQAGYKTGVYRSPHLLNYHERVRVNGKNADDDMIIDSFVKTLVACQQSTLSYFEFSTIAALQSFVDNKVDIAILEVGLGGRLDVVNIVDPIISIVTNVGIDHIDWLGDDREIIAWEKAHIYRPNRLAICGDSNPPQKLVDYSTAIKAKLSLINRDFKIISNADDRYLRYVDVNNDQNSIAELAQPRLRGSYQRNNLGCALTAINVLKNVGFTCSEGSINAGVQQASLPGRLQKIIDEDCVWLLDVGHNGDAAVALSQYLQTYKQHNPNTLIYGLFGVMKDKDIDGIVTALINEIEHWHLCAPAIDRAMPVSDLQGVVEKYVAREKVSSDLSIKKTLRFIKTKISDQQKIAYNKPQLNCSFKPLIVIFGSFYTVGEALTVLIDDKHITSDELL
jgi:dihydrofolate synthase/folylpolyglutamate synthase